MAVDKRRGKNKQTKPAAVATAPPKRRAAQNEGWREAIESIVVALILAFLFRAFEGEAFEIPTGSMGPTLMGRHKELDCPECGHSYRVGASSEVDQTTGRVIPSMLVQRATCPNCRFTARVGPGAAEETPSHKGDRLWVSKAPYAVAEPQRWDVAVFKWPIQSRENYIKRIVGLPGEQLRIHAGNLHVRLADDDEFEVARKPHDKVESIMQSVYDNDHRSAALDAWGWPARWQVADESTAEVEVLDGQRRFSIRADENQSAWVRYRHFVPSYEDWLDLHNDRALTSQPRPQLISDFTAYNTATPVVNAPGPAPDVDSLGLNWVADLILECEVEVHEPRGAVVLELIEAGRAYRCRFDLASGEAVLSIEGQEDFAPRAETSVDGRGRHQLRLANVDDQLLLWVDGSPVEFDRATSYSPPGDGIPQEADLSPAAVGVEGGEVTVGSLHLYRDVYYIAHNSNDPSAPFLERSDYRRNPYLFPHPSRQKLAEFMSSPDQWEVFGDLRTADFRLEADQFFAMGDNSPNSSDSRYWTNEHYFGRELLIGKAFFIYWPRALVPSWHWEFTIAGRAYRVPFLPNYHRIGFIH